MTDAGPPLQHQPGRAFTVLAADSVASTIEADRAGCMAVVAQAYAHHDQGRSALPHSSFLRIPGQPRNRIIALPGYLGGDFGVSGIKWIASYPENHTISLPRASAVLLLNDTVTGQPFACLEGSIVSATRTAASAVLAAETLQGGRHASSVGFIGAGLIADHVRMFFADLGWDVGRWRVHDLDGSQADRLADRLRADGAADVRVVDTAQAIFGDCDVVVVATVSSEPYLTDPQLLRHKPLVLHLSLRDISPELVLAAQNITDDVDHAVRENTSLHLAEMLVGHRSFIDGTLSDVVEGRVRRSSDRAVLFAPFGLGVLDLALGLWVYRRVSASGAATTVDGFHPGSATFPPIPDHTAGGAHEQPLR